MKNRNILKTFIISLVLSAVSFVFFSSAVPQVSADRIQELVQEIEELEGELKRLNAQANTLENQISQFDAQINLTELKIEETEERINLLGGRINLLEVSLQSLTKAFSSRVNETYKMARLGDPLVFFVTSDNLSEAVTRYHYLQRIQEADRELMTRLQDAQETYVVEKDDQEELQAELQKQQQVLGAQKTAKAELLQITRNDESRYQQLLAQARAEYEAIQAIIAGKGTETEFGPVNEGVRIANIIQGSSCNSRGTHLHFTVRTSSGVTDNPFKYLKSGVSYEDNSGEPGGDPFNPSGDWEWPISPTIKFNQGYGYTWAIQNNSDIRSIYSFHNGIDINSLSSSDVKSVQSGVLYQGSYTGNNGCRLKYVRVDHGDSDIDTLYLHVNY